MLEISPRTNTRFQRESKLPGVQAGSYLSVDDIFRFAVLNKKSIFLFSFAGFVLGGIYLLLAQPTFTATALVIVDPQSIQALSPSTAQKDFPNDPKFVDAQVEIMKSDKAITFVIKSLSSKLNFDAEGAGILSGLGELRTKAQDVFCGVREWFGILCHGSDDAEAMGQGPSSQDGNLRDVVALTRKSLEIRRVGLTSLVEVSYSSSERQRAASIANAFAQAFSAVEIEGNVELANSAQNWIKSNLQRLQESIDTSKKSIISIQQSGWPAAIPTSSAAAPVRLDLVRASELNSQLSAATSQVAKLEGLAQFLAAAGPGEPLPILTPGGESAQVVAKLRTKAIDVEERLHAWSVKYGEETAGAIALKGELENIRVALDNEARHQRRQIQAELDAARASEKFVKEKLNEALAVTVGIENNMWEINSLLGQIKAYQSAYDELLRRSNEMVLRRTYPLSGMRVVSDAPLPAKRSTPNSAGTLSVATFIGFMVGTVLAIYRGLRYIPYTSSEETARRLGLFCLATIPAQPAARRRVADLLLGRHLRKEAQPRFPATPAAAAVGPNHFMEAIQAVKLGLQEVCIDNDGKVGVFVSSTSDEGRSLIAASVSVITASSKLSVLLIETSLSGGLIIDNLFDWNDGPESSAERACGSIAELGLDSLIRPCKRVPGLDFLPRRVFSREFSEDLGVFQTELSSALAYARTKYDYVFVDLEPFDCGPFARVALQLADVALFVVRANFTARSLVQRSVQILKDNGDCPTKVVMSDFADSPLRSPLL
jgi:succinoglycan biosynthesis transport protein ExoP